MWREKVCEVKAVPLEAPLFRIGTSLPEAGLGCYRHAFHRQRECGVQQEGKNCCRQTQVLIRTTYIGM